MVSKTYCKLYTFPDSVIITFTWVYNLRFETIDKISLTA